MLSKFRVKNIKKSSELWNYKVFINSLRKLQEDKCFCWVQCVSVWRSTKTINRRILYRGMNNSLKHGHPEFSSQTLLRDRRTLELGLSSTTKMTKTLALRAAWTADATLSFPSRNKPLPSETISNNCAVSEQGNKRDVKIKGTKKRNVWK